MLEQGMVSAQSSCNELAPTTSVNDLGLDSIGKMALVLELEREMNCPLSIEEFQGVVTLADLEGVVERALMNTRVA